MTGLKRFLGDNTVNGEAENASIHSRKSDFEFPKTDVLLGGPRSETRMSCCTGSAMFLAAWSSIGCEAIDSVSRDRVETNPAPRFYH